MKYHQILRMELCRVRPQWSSSHACCIRKVAQSSSPRAGPQNEDELEVAEINEDVKDGLRDIGCFKTMAYKSMDILVRIDQIEDVPHLLCEASPAYTAALGASVSIVLPIAAVTSSLSTLQSLLSSCSTA